MVIVFLLFVSRKILRLVLRDIILFAQKLSQDASKKELNSSFLISRLSHAHILLLFYSQTLCSRKNLTGQETPGNCQIPARICGSASGMRETTRFFKNPLRNLTQTLDAIRYCRLRSGQCLIETSCHRIHLSSRKEPRRGKEETCQKISCLASPRRIMKQRLTLNLLLIALTQQKMLFF